MFVLRHHLPDRYGLTIGGGTRSKETIAREAAENCPTCRVAREREEKANANDPEGKWLDELFRRYLLKVKQEQDERRAGRWYAADFYLRQLTHIELALDTGERGGDLLEQFTANPDRDGDLYASPLSTVLAERRAALWAANKDSPRPPIRLRRTMTEDAIGGADTAARYRVRAECEARIAAAQDEWEATRTEESWAAWCAGKP